ncbi:hypothetical protein [Alteromonas sp. ALT199]|uniref:hypothetical protein n=1 Tax=unclassified Alteromonas TaxID=2614992 RepID=UPI002037360D|nr:hypothetical protein [Alteromonas sp. ALT199]
MQSRIFSLPRVMPPARLFIACCTLPLLVACESTPPELDTSLIPESQKADYRLNMSKAKACPVNLAELVDTRSSKDLLVGNSSVAEDTLYALLQQSLENMNVSPNIDASNSVKVVLNRAFVKSLGSNMVATVVLEVRFKPAYAEAYSPVTVFKGRSMNVNTDEEESNQIAIDAMKTAIDDATKRIKSSLLHNCGDALSELEAV